VKFIGDRMVRKEDPRLLTGRGRYLGDLTPPGTVHAAFVRSPHANARVRGLNTDRARRMPGVIAVVSFDDLGPAARELPCAPLHPALTARNFHLLAPGRVRFVGEAVAVVVAGSRYTAEDAAEAVDADWEVMAAVQDPTAPGRGRVHDDVPDNVAGRITLRHGDVEAALRRAPRTLSERFVVSRGGGQPMEPRGVLAAWDATADLLTVWASSQVPHQIRQVVCQLLGLPQHQVRVVAPDVGGSFGAKLIVYPEDVLVPWLALRLGVPVKWQEDRLEHMRTATQERVQVHEVTVGFDEHGRILALRDHFVHDTGAYTPRGLVVPLLTASMLPGPYRIPSVEVSFASVYTNRVPVTPYRGAGQPQAVFVIERVLDRIARATGRDRAAVRLDNMVQSADMPYDVGLTNYRNDGHVVYDSGDFPAVLRHALRMADYERLRAETARARGEGRWVGVGVAAYVELTGVGPFEGATVRVEASGRITVFTGITSQGQGLETTLAQVCASELGVTPDEIEVVLGDTGGIAHGIGTFASRAATVGGTAVALAARELRAKAAWIASRVLAVPEDGLQQDGAAFVDRARPDRRATLAELAASAGLASGGLGAGGPGVTPGLEATRFYQPENIAYSGGAHVVLAEVDPVSLRVAVRGYWISHDSGRLINPMVVEGQIQGAVALGLGATLLEEVVYDDAGQPLTGTYMDYLLPTATDVPAMVIDHLETLSPLNPLGFKGVGESGALPVAAALASAIEDALAARSVLIREVPITPVRLQALLDAADSSPLIRSTRSVGSLRC
jgi:carbon-monoxide dehydrogenase large subunit